MGTIECCVCRHKKETRFFRILGATHGSFDFNDVCHACEDPLDHDVYSMDREDLMATVKKLRAAIRADRDTNAHDLCWYRPELWNLLPEKVDPDPKVPCPEEFLRRCAEYRMSLNKAGA